MKRQIPSLVALECFEAVVKYGLVTRAAEELHLTQSAVSRQIASLETYTRQQLFTREKKRLQPTEAARQFAQVLTPLLQGLEQETMRLMTSSVEDKVLKLGLLPTFGSRWLIPRLGEFTEKHPDIQLNIVTGLTYDDFAAANVDVAVLYGQGDFPGFSGDRLLDEQLVPVIAPAHYGNPDIMAYEHLQMATRPDAWRDWLGAQQMSISQQSLGPKFENFTMMIEAVRSGLGVAVLPHMYIEADLNTGRLLAPFGSPVTSQKGYYLVAADQLYNSAKVSAFRSWLLSGLQT
jgi:LysR family glycine cleavage system transcriptional activator